MTAVQTKPSSFSRSHPAATDCGLGLRVAIVHDYLTQRGGAERVVLAMLRAFPGARLLTALYDADRTFPSFRRQRVETSALQKVAAFRNDPRRALPLLASAFNRMRVRDVDVVLCSSSGWAHGVKAVAPKVVYCYNPARWIYQHSDYVAAQRPIIRGGFMLLRPYLRSWDRRAAGTAERYLTTSTTVQNRIRSSYGIRADLLAPPISLDPHGRQQSLPGVKAGYFLAVGRARGYKNLHATCEAFEQMPDQRLIVVGALPERQGGKSWGGNIRGAGCVLDAQLRWLYHNCCAVIATANEDFGLTPLEGNAFGRPALVLRAGGFLDTLVEGVTGYFIEDLSVESVIDSVRRLLAADLDSRRIFEHADGYSMDSFIAQLRHHVLAAAKAGAHCAEHPAEWFCHR